jgi:prepilin peptidase CpaA
VNVTVFTTGSLTAHNREIEMPATIFLFLMLEFAAVSYGDVKTRKIPNYWSLFNVVVFIFLLFIFPEFYKFSLGTFFYSMVFLAVGFLLFCLKVMGGGDSKFLASSYLLIPVAYQDRSLEFLLYVTIGLGIPVLLYNITKNKKEIKAAMLVGDVQKIKGFFGKKTPFAPVIFLSWLALGVELEIWKNV